MIDVSTFQKKRVAFHTLGCKLNFSESSALATTLNEAGFLTARNGEKTDLLVFNTCSVTELADKKCRNVIRSEIKKHPDAYVVVTGCYAQLSPDEIAKIDGVDLVLGSNEKFRLLEFIQHMEKELHAGIHVGELKGGDLFYPSYSGSDRTRCFLKVQDGCDYFCSYCTIPFARGRSRSGTINETMKMAGQAIREGAREIVLTGVNIGDFGNNSTETFYDLLLAFDQLDQNVRIRVGSVEPNLLTDEIIDLVAGSSVLMPHFHLPLQSGSDSVLQLMNRRYTTRFFANRIERIKETIPNAFIGIDVIVGANGESKALFDETYAYLLGLDFSQLHVFTYSQRPDTKAIKIDHVVTPQEKRERANKLLMLSEKKHRHFYQSQLNTKARVLFEAQKVGELMSGFTGNYTRVSHTYSPELVNKTVVVEVVGYNLENDTMMCKIL